ncbi:MAG: hypothetical protein A3A96_04035 [Candidatus Zambryskibacteria bacterium RIFCSPLOWO2_01_FULL_39_39]|uniref:CMP/dCMP-type deaminase domain-containing protein n=1 Tax=Candidatus Zambryskibacteria bacterium RIFCSPLOWO2_01_FULL_39_39 TaxID=1802758 RepID=A0A1G2U149_9BACT|nr:MAG: hypothetical protein UT00_C0006G0063 [Parcubacteria group bacterium GW2011_GWA1_38_7]OHA87117.1 MAG: hypothetical protein A2644_03620 [Candidatus Zambryskibacteria bacterium RIFCSPHIGHO2_01_FULL_39_63]OHA94658.1 MAG: hypothetical protein A3B88_00425 [Candidatus Zambryskibacteria bacterium RIFCSPHIGHO2_02_FULL_39_19]OHA98109.1 MAG: hypothetical protein A3F20_01325 [Candidatus Zambryskibacteria bacterium RIFCSPHIGHO2_12_FULL_39_21]OHB02572.1 MAG: hypothetical protein A3A96_04035 [Candidat
MDNLIAYIPVLNQQYAEWLKGHQRPSLFLIDQGLAEKLVPRLARNIIARSTARVLDNILSEMLVHDVSILTVVYPRIICYQPVMPNDDVSHAYAHEYRLTGQTFENVWGRWDMTAVTRQEPVIPDLEVSSEEIDRLRMESARKLAQASPDWWRQIGALAFRDGEVIACAYNAHKPNEYETALFSDPRINFDAGDPLGAEVYLSLHAEKGLIGVCAREGVRLKGASVYVTTFPCADCARYLAETQIKELFFSDGYSVLGGLRTLQAAGIRIVQVKKVPESA